MSLKFPKQCISWGRCVISKILSRVQNQDQLSRLKWKEKNDILPPKKVHCFTLQAKQWSSNKKRTDKMRLACVQTCHANGMWLRVELSHFEGNDWPGLNVWVAPWKGRERLRWSQRSFFQGLRFSVLLQIFSSFSSASNLSFRESSRILTTPRNTFFVSELFSVFTNLFYLLNKI